MTFSIPGNDGINVPDTQYLLDEKTMIKLLLDICIQYNKPYPIAMGRPIYRIVDEPMFSWRGALRLEASSRPSSNISCAIAH